MVQGKQIYDKKRNLRVLFYQKEDKKLQLEQNDRIAYGNYLAKIAILFGALGFLAQLLEVFVNLIK